MRPLQSQALKDLVFGSAATETTIATAIYSRILELEESTQSQWAHAHVGLGHCLLGAADADAAATHFARAEARYVGADGIVRRGR